MLLIIDNYDSFTYNLVQYFGELGEDPKVLRNDEVSIREIENDLRPDRIVVSPGPGTPDDAGVSLAVIENFAGKLPLLGVCLGHQALAQSFGGQVVHAPFPVHGKPSGIRHNEKGLFEGIRNPFDVGRYHSLIVDRKGLPEEFEVTAETEDGLIMGLRHRPTEACGVQFHPESILTSEGKILLQNFLGF